MNISTKSVRQIVLSLLVLFLLMPLAVSANTSDQQDPNVGESDVSTEVDNEETSGVEETTALPAFTEGKANLFEVTTEANIYTSVKANTPRGVLKENQRFKSVVTENGFHQIVLGNDVGYVKVEDTVLLEGAMIQAFTPLDTDGRMLTATETATIYDNKTGSLVPFAELNPGEQIPVVSDYGPNWWKVNVANRTGYVKKSQVTIDFSKTDDYFKVIKDDVIVYDNRSGSIVPVGTLEKGQAYPRVRDYGNWHQIQFGDYYGYVKKSETTVAKGTEIKNELTQAPNFDRAFTTETDVTVYDNSSGALVPFAEILEGKETSIIRDYGNWWEIAISNRTGYVKKSEVSVNFKPSDEYFQATEDDVTVYDNRSGSIVPVGTLEKGQVYPRVRDYGNWHQIQFGDYYGYVKKSKTTLASGAGLKNEYNGNMNTARTFTALDEAVVYDNTSGSLVPFMTVKEGKEASIIADYGNWWQIIMSDRVGYVKKSETKASFKNTDKFFIAVEEDIPVYDNRSGALEQVATLTQGETYERVKNYGNWHQIQFDDGYYGYVKKSETTPGSSAAISNRTSAAPENDREYIVKKDTPVYYSNRQSTFMTLSEGTKATIDKDAGDYWRVIVGERIGYIKQSDVRVAFRATDKYFRVLEDDVVIYDNRSGSLTRVGTLSAGEEYRRTGEMGNWHKIQFNHYTGYVKKADTTFTYGTNVTNESTKIQSLDEQITFSTDVTVHVSPNASTDIIGTIDEGVSYQVLDYNSSWYKILISNRIGYVSKAELGIHTLYDLTLDEMAEIQLTRRPQTDKYRNEPGYIHSSLVKIVEESIISGDGVALRTEPSTLDGNQTVYGRVNRGTTVEILAEVTGTAVGGDTTWYKIRFEGQTLYVHSSLVETNAKAAQLTSNANVRSTPSTNSHIYGTAKSGSSVNVLDKVNGTSVGGNTEWYKVSYTTWRLPTKADLLEFLDPEKQDPFQFLDLAAPANVTTSQLNNILLNKGTLSNEGDSFIKAGERHGVNEIYLISHALLETGQGQSALARGVEVGLNASNQATLVTDANRNSLTNIKRVYNMYGIGAYDNVALTAGATYAYNNGWTSPSIAIIEGARFVSDNYFGQGQTTLYQMRWNPGNPGVHQYATDIGWAAKQIYRMKQLYELIEHPSLTYDIPKYK